MDCHEIMFRHPWMSPNYFVDPLTFHLAALAGQTLHVKSISSITTMKFVEILKFVILKEISG